jgi:hypothetical protein
VQWQDGYAKRVLLEADHDVLGEPARLLSHQPRRHRAAPVRDRAEDRTGIADVAHTDVVEVHGEYHFGLRSKAAYTTLPTYPRGGCRVLAALRHEAQAAVAEPAQQEAREQPREEDPRPACCERLPEQKGSEGKVGDLAKGGGTGEGRERGCPEDGRGADDREQADVPLVEPPARGAASSRQAFAGRRRGGPAARCGGAGSPARPLLRQALFGG